MQAPSVSSSFSFSFDLRVGGHGDFQLKKSSTSLRSSEFSPCHFRQRIEVGQQQSALSRTPEPLRTEPVGPIWRGLHRVGQLHPAANTREGQELQQGQASRTCAEGQAQTRRVPRNNPRIRLGSADRQGCGRIGSTEVCHQVRLQIELPTHFLPRQNANPGVVYIGTGL